MLRLKLFFVLITISSYAFSQNLVPNNSFDIGKSVKKFIPDLWESDFLYASYFIECGIANCSNYHGSGKPRKKIFNSAIKPKTGKCYAGFYNYSYSDRRGYWGIKLTDTLKKDKYYEVEMYVCRYIKSDVWIKNIEVLFSNSKPDFVNSKFPVDWEMYKKLEENKQIVKLTNSTKTWLNKEKNDWTKISAKYKAKGNEIFITIGNLKNNNRTEHLCNPKHSHNDSMAYYFIEDVKVEEIITDFFIETNVPLILKNIFFNIGKSNLLTTSFPELKKLEKYLREYPQRNIEISGHTDNTGNAKSNKMLSEKRAKSVVDFLVSKGINKNRLTHIGYGSSKPIDTNTTSTGRQNNRRVEVKIINY